VNTSDLVNVYSLTDATKAEIIKGFLHGEGIRCFLGGEQAAANLGIPAFEVDVMVPAGDADRARKLIERHEKHMV
jgi:hypothetical protein